MADVVQVVLEFCGSVLHRPAVAIVDLSPAGGAGARQHTRTVEGYLALEARYQRRAFSPGADQAHRAEQDVPELRDLIEPRAAHDASDTRNPRIARFCPACLTVRFGIRHHRTELDHTKRLAPAAGAFLTVEYRPARVQTHQQCQQREERGP